ncbi:hypothetical protein OG897_36420 [Streptomyces sp. NBC_00237]|uniref:hypothetical protein n=1 Tax=Streptomyces sp. NBC_00237 TaxID=2975687 RepID=UPI002258E5F2|nr:hypothetical protein [Streptomyces sp. NBC_00237]MCX5206873.1 hypothetical protein [Streptomyces sp. NBC_00237]
MTYQAWITLGGAVLALSTFIAGLCGTARSRVRQVEDFYTARYWKLLDQMPMTGFAGERDTTAEERAVRLYLGLCEDELALRKAGWVSGSTWAEWRQGMVAALAEGPVREAWIRVLAISGGTEYEHLQNLAKDPDYDPCEVHGLGRRWRRLNVPARPRAEVPVSPS